MKAIFLQRHGGNEVIEYGDLPDPVAGPGEVLVRLEASAFNRLDIFVRDGIPGVPVSFPHVPGADGSGRVAALGAGVSRVKVGDRVVIQPGLSCGSCELCRAGEQSLCVRFGILGEHASGTFAELVAVPAANVFPAPESLSAEQAAAFSLDALTAWRMLVTRAALRPGESVLIHGAGGGVSTFALQIARLCGASPVYVTSRSPEKRKRAQELGADATLDAGGDVGKRVRELTRKRGVDVVVDSVGAATWRASLVCAAKGGRIVTCGATSGPNPEEEIRHIFWKQLSILGSTMGNDAEYSALLAAVAAGRVVPVVDEVLPLAEARRGYERMESGEGYGKIVLRVGQGSAG
ncbi:MAG TPA: zinc-binding dehydrogenase [Thermoanaerobaculia bacterium]|nr:zinc-binding dehydrogenase [Thermoanaerobaculia bacterium]